MEKLKVILVDDETLICKLICMKVNWKLLDMVVIEKFSSSKKALDRVPALKPDIIITDICMPGMNGLEFSEKCINLLPNVKVIILTGYDEFNYAMQSIHVGVADYILKPVNGEKLNDSLMQVKERILKERMKAEKYEELVAQIEQNLPVFCENFLNQIITTPVSSEIFRKKMRDFHKWIHPSNESVQAAIVEINKPISRVAGGGENDEIILYMKARGYIEHFFERDSYMLFWRDSIGRITILSNNQELHFVDALEVLKKMLITNLQCLITIGIGTVKQSYERIDESYREAAEALQYKVVEKENSLIFYEGLSECREKKSGSRIHEIVRYMNENLNDPDLSMNKVAQHLFISTGHLGRMMKKCTGKTYCEYLSELRFSKAKELLGNTSLRGYEIGERIGILDSHYLSIWFKKMSGCSLSEYRKNTYQNNEHLGLDIEFCFHEESL